jgi:hypothetical protein
MHFIVTEYFVFESREFLLPYFCDSECFHQIECFIIEAVRFFKTFPKNLSFLLMEDTVSFGKIREIVALAQLSKKRDFYPNLQ